MDLHEGRSKPGRISPDLGLLILFVLLALARGIVLDIRLRPFASCTGCTALLAMRHDAVILGAVLAIYGVAQWTGWRGFPRGARILACFAVAAFGLDLLILLLYNMRLVMGDFVKYGREIGGILSVGRYMIETPQGLVILLVLVLSLGLMVAVIRSTARLGPRGIRGVLAAASALLFLGLTPRGGVKPLGWAYRNVVEVNLEWSVGASYSDEFAADLKATHRDLRWGEECATVNPRRPDVILVILEGFSMYHSRLFSGLGDLTPNLDRIASRHTAFTRFWANGFTTENGLIALLGGEVPIPAPGQVVFGGGFAFHGFSDLPNSLPRQFSDHGYHTGFLTTGDLRFSGKGAWLERLGFHEIWGHDDPFYQGWDRLHFSAPPDSALYLRAMQWLDNHASDSPFFLVIETVSSHHPFIEPESRRQSEEAVFRYADRQLGHFYDALMEGGVLDGALLLVVSDHRTMTPLRERELGRFGEEAPSLIPFVLADPASPGPRRVDQPFQQVDLAPSVRGMLSGRSCPTLVRGDVLNRPPTPPGCVFRPRADDRGRIDVRCGGRRAVIRLRGDETHVEGGYMPREEALLSQINSERLDRVGVRLARR